MANKNDLTVTWKIGEKEKVEKRAKSRGMSFNVHVKDVILRAIEREENASKRKR